MNLIELKNISFQYPDGTEALSNITLTIEKGKKVAILGENGSGKSTLFLVLNGINKIRHGEYHFRDEEITYSKKQLKQLIQNIGIVFQDPDIQLFASSVYQEISFGPKNIGLSDSDTERRVESAMMKTGVTHLKDKPPHALSYGEKKRVAIADILAMDTEIVVLDEPLAWLDLSHRRKIIDILGGLSDENRTVILSTNDPDFAYSWSDHVILLKKGRVIGAGNPEQLFLNSNLMQQAGLEIPFVVELASKLRLKDIPRNREQLLSQIGRL